MGMKPRNTVATFNKALVKRLRRTGAGNRVCRDMEAVYVTKEKLESWETGLMYRDQQFRARWCFKGSDQGTAVLPLHLAGEARVEHDGHVVLNDTVYSVVSGDDTKIIDLQAAC